ncbi:hypothetical protein ENBRE01_1894 [Enteropsectra breve]|nr:hypothetical protein ENBRE01_1894 [Enteropsectra breve]
MKTFDLIVRFAKILFLMLAAVGLAKVALVAVYGWWKMDLNYAPSYIYNWRLSYIDNDLPKKTFARIKLDSQAKNETLSKYVKDVQEGNTDSKSGAINLPQTNGNTLAYPHYTYGFPDTFVLGPAFTWTLLDGEENLYKADMKFLSLRNDYIQNFYWNRLPELDLELTDAEKKKEEEKYKALSAKDKADADAKEVSLKAADILEKPEGFNRQILAKSKRTEKPIFPPRYAHFAYLKNQNEVTEWAMKHTEVNYLSFMELCQYLTQNTEKLVTREGEQYKMVEGLSALVMDFIGRSSIFNGLNITTDSVNAWLSRIATLKFSSADVQILNRIYFYFLYTHNSMKLSTAASEDLPEDLKATLKLAEASETEHDEAIDGSSEEEKKTRKDNERRKATNKIIKAHQARTEQMFNQFSLMFARAFITDEKSQINQSAFSKFYNYKSYGVPQVYKKDPKDYFANERNALYNSVIGTA